MPALPSGSANPISFRDIWHNIYGKEGDEIPTLSLNPCYKFKRFIYKYG